MAKKDNINNYFSHDSNARNSDKIIRLRMRHKAAGYGVYFMILERLREEPEYMSVRDYNVIAYDLREDTALIKSVVEDFGLFVFTEDGKYFYSEGFKRRMDIKDEKSKRLSEAGKRGMASRWPSEKNESEEIKKDNQDITTLYPPYNDVITTDNKVITRKEKERKEINKEIDKERKPPKSEAPARQKKESLKINYEGLVDLFNKTFEGKLPLVRGPISEKRKRAIKARIDEHDKETVMEVFQKVLHSSFLLGHTNSKDSNWKCSFDFIFSPSGFQKILEGNYDDEKNTTQIRNERREVERQQVNQEIAKRNNDRATYAINPFQLVKLRELSQNGNETARMLLSGELRMTNLEITQFIKSVT